MNMIQRAGIVAVVAAVIVAGLYVFEPLFSAPVVDVGMLATTSAKYSLSFEYPKDYFVIEHDGGTPERLSHTIMIVQDAQGNRDLLSGKIKNTDGLPTITMQMFQNNLDHYTTDTWVRSSKDSNFKTSPDGKLAEAGFTNGESALQYRWSGLHEGITVVAAHPDWVYAFSVTYASSSDQIIKDFAQILTTVQFTQSK